MQLRITVEIPLPAAPVAWGLPDDATPETVLNEARRTYMKVGGIPPDVTVDTLSDAVVSGDFEWASVGVSPESSP